jgi:hypothetical protein
MKKYPVQRKPIVPRERDAIDSRERNAIVPRQHSIVPRERDVEVFEAAPLTSRSAFSFRYSYTEISADGERARVKTKRARYEDGKLSTESFEAEVDRGGYDRMIDDAQRLFLQQTALFQRMLSAFLPVPPRRERDRD